MSASYRATYCSTRRKLRSGAAILAIFFTSGVVAAAQDWRWAVSSKLIQERIVGLLNLPEIVGETCGPAEPKSAGLYDAPTTSAPPIASIHYSVMNRLPDGSNCDSAKLVVRRVDARFDEDLPTEETGYEIAAAVVYERSGRWFRIALQRGSAWILRQNQDAFEAYPELLMNKLAYIDTGWDGRVWQTPEISTGRPAAGWTPYLAQGIPVQVLATRRLNDNVWIHVRLETNVCGETLAGVTSTTGWIPAYRPAGTPSVWFHSRGC